MIMINIKTGMDDMHLGRCRDFLEYHLSTLIDLHKHQVENKGDQKYIHRIEDEIFLRFFQGLPLIGSGMCSEYRNSIKAQEEYVYRIRENRYPTPIQKHQQR